MNNSDYKPVSAQISKDLYSRAMDKRASLSKELGEAVSLAEVMRRALEAYLIPTVAE